MTMTLGERKARAKAYVAKVRAKTVCKRCGRKPVDFHREEHTQNHNWRIGPRMSRGNSPAVIQAEIDLCEPLCRSCHMKHDGRAAALTANRPRHKGDVLPLKPCRVCRTPSKPLRRGRCNRCNHRFRKGTGP